MDASDAAAEVGMACTSKSCRAPSVRLTHHGAGRNFLAGHGSKIAVSLVER